MKTSKATIKGRGRNQVEYLKQIRTFDLTLGIGPAGTGKTYLAVASAVNALENDEVQRLVLVRPAVEAGERLGFLPGDLAQKIDPYLRPMYDALYEMMGFQKVAKLIERNVIEIAPLAYMRGRTLNDSFIILDEAQNTTIDQMKMFLTRIGFGSRAVVTGDVTQVDLGDGKSSGLRVVQGVLRSVDGVGFMELTGKDVVRHRIVAAIVEAYRRYEDRRIAEQDERLPVPEPSETGQGRERRRRHRRGRGQIEVVEVLEPREAGLGDAPLAATGIALLHLRPEELGEEGAVAEVVPHGGLGEPVMLGPHGGQAQRPAGLLDREGRGLLGDRGAHREVPVPSSAS